MARITVEMISQKQFSISNKGYNQSEVDDFLDDICDEIERMENEIMDLARRPRRSVPLPRKTAESARRTSRASGKCWPWRCG